MSETLVSVIVLNYNGKQIIQECVDSILASYYPQLEVVIVENGSTDGSLEFLKKLYKNNVHVRIVPTKKNLWFTGGCNLGAAHAKGEKLLFTSNDVIFDPYCIAELMKHADNKRHLTQPTILFYNNHQIVDNVGGKYTWYGYGIGQGRGTADNITQIKKLDYVSATTCLIDRSFFEEVGGFDDWFKTHSEDVDFSLRARKLKGSCWLIPKAKVYHKGSLTLKKHVTNDLLLFHVRKNRLRTVTKNFDGLRRVRLLTCILITYVLIMIKDIFSLKLHRFHCTRRAIKAAFKS